MGSLFDGIGGFPLAASRYGIKTLWASEIERFPIAVTKLRFPDLWTMIPSASDSGRYKALGNSVAIPCVEFVMGGIATAILIENEKRRRRRRVYRIDISLPMAA